MSAQHATSVLLGRDRALEAAAAALRGAPADHAEVSIAARTSSVLRFAGTRVHQPQDLAELICRVRAVVGGRSARTATSSLADLPAALARAAESAAALGSAPLHAGTPPPHLPAGPQPEPSVPAERFWCQQTEAWSAAAGAATLRALLRPEGPAPSGAGDFAGALAAGTIELAVATTGGAGRYAAATEASFSCTASHGSGTSRAEELGRDVGELDVAGLAEAIAAEAAAMDGAGELAPGSYDVVFGPQAVAELIAFLPAFGFTAPALRSGVGVVATGGRRFSPLVTVADDALAAGGLPFPFDCEGVTKRRVELIAAGVPGGVVSDLESGAVTGGSTGHAHIAREEVPAPRASNLRLEPGSSTLADLVAGVERGVYVQRLWYTRVVDPARGLITGTTRDAAFEIAGGELGRPVRGMRFTESVLDALERADGVGDTLHFQPVMNVWNGAAGAPAIRVRGFRLGVAAPPAS